MKQVDDDTVSNAYNHFVEVFYPGEDLREGKGLYFWKFLGMNVSPHTERGPGWRLTDDAAYRCHLLAGPHYQAVAKLMSLKGHTHNLKCKTHLSIETEGEYT